MSALVIGLTVVALGTSAPETAISVAAALKGQPDIALGNVIGSNIMNVLVVLGVSALLSPMMISRQTVKIDVPVMIGVSLLLYLFAFNGVISRVESFVLFGGIVLYTVWLLRKNKRQNALKNENGAPQKAPKKSIANFIYWGAGIVVGIALLVFGAELLIDAATEIARMFGISELVISLTVIALGTSLPEIATSIAAVVKKERDLAIGNVVGSNISNILLVLGLSGAASPNGISVAPAALNFDIPVMIVVAAACLPIFFTGYRMGRREGLLFLVYYAAYAAYLILDASGHDALPQFSWIMLQFALPLTLITLVILTGVAWKRQRKST